MTDSGQSTANSQVGRRLKLAAFIGAGALVAGLIATSGPVASATEAGTKTPSAIATDETAAIIEQTIRMRGDLGLPVLSDSTLTKLAKSPLTSPSFIQWGFLGTNAEAQEVLRRQQLSSVAQDIRSVLASKTNSAGIFLDNKVGGKLVVGYAGTEYSSQEKDQIVAELTKRGHKKSDVLFRPQEHTSSELQDAITQVWDWSSRNPGTVLAVADDLPNNAVSVTLAPSAARSSAAQALPQLAGVDVPLIISSAEVKEAACIHRRECDAPQRAGVSIAGPGGTCTSGWIVNRGSGRAAITAGHCWYGRTSSAITSDSGLFFGNLPLNPNALRVGSHLDARIVNVNVPTSRPWIYQHDGIKERVVSRAQFAEGGNTVCAFTRSANYPKCGVVASNNASHYSATVNGPVYGQIRANFAVIGGDSGSAVAVGATGDVATGITSALIGTAQSDHSSIVYLANEGMGYVAFG